MKHLLDLINLLLLFAIFYIFWSNTEMKPTDPDIYFFIGALVGYGIVMYLKGRLKERSI